MIKNTISTLLLMFASLGAFSQDDLLDQLEAEASQRTRIFIFASSKIFL
jgi:hypothetical protein